MENERELLLVAIFTFLTVTLWISFELIKTVKTTTVAPDVAQIIAPLPAIIDTALINEIKERKTY